MVTTLLTAFALIIAFGRRLPGEGAYVAIAGIALSALHWDLAAWQQKIKDAITTAADKRTPFQWHMYYKARPQVELGDDAAAGSPERRCAVPAADAMVASHCGNRSGPRPRYVTSDIAPPSRYGSMGGLVTWAKSCLK